MNIIRKLWRPKRNKLIASVLLFILLFNFGLSLKPQKPMPVPGAQFFPYSEKLADGVWALHNQEPVRQKLAAYQKADTNLKKNDGNARYEWSVTLKSKTTFSFGLRDGKKIKPLVEVKAVSGESVVYGPSENSYVLPRVKGNVVEWEIDENITARYTMQQDRVKADYIVANKTALQDAQMGFDVVHSRGIVPELLPGGDITWLEKSGKEVFSFPKPYVVDRDNVSIDSFYDVNEKDKNSFVLSIELDKKQFADAQFPITVDPVVIDSTGIDVASTSIGNARKIVRDAWGNLIAVFEGGLAEGDVWYKNYNSNTWTEQVIGISGPGNSVTIDIDSEGNVHTFNDVAGGTDGDVGYVKLTVTRNASNVITSISGSTELILDDSNKAFRPTLLVANKGEGAGKEKVVAAWAMNTTVGGTRRGEMRLLQCDIADNCATAASWKNVTETTNASGSCVEGTSGIASTTTCAGAADIMIQYTAAHTNTNGVITQIPGAPNRNAAAAFFFDGATYTTLTNALDNSTGTVADLSGLDTTNDYLYIGDDAKFSKVVADVTNNNTQADSQFTIEYWNGASWTVWTASGNFVDRTMPNLQSSNVCGGGVFCPFYEDGALMFDEPSNWATTSVNGTSKYWIRLSPNTTFDASVSIAEFYVGERNAKALMVAVGTDDTDDLGVSFITWDDVGQSSWEAIPAISTGNSWTENTTAIDTLGGNWTTFTNYPLNAMTEYIYNTTYVSYIEDQAADVLHIKSVPNNKDLSVAASWTDTAFPPVTEGVDLAMSMTSDGSDLYMFYILDPGTNNLVWRMCNPSGGGDPKICDNASDWGSEQTLVADTTLSHPQAVVSKAGGDTIAFDFIYTDTTDLDVLYERRYVNLADKIITVAASGDDAVHRDCDAGSSVDDSVIDSTQLVLGRNISANIGTDCGGSGDVTYHTGIRFPSVAVAQGAAVSSAYLDIRVDLVQGNPISFNIYGEDTDDSAIYTNLTNACDATCVGNRTRTTNSHTVTDWSPTTITYRFDVTEVVQEIVCRGATNAQPCVGDFNSTGSWASGNDLGLLLITTSSQNAADIVLPVAFDHTTNEGQDPTLHINLSVPGKIYSSNNSDLIPTGSGSYSNFNKSFSMNDYNAVGLDDNSYASMSANLNQTASQSAQPAYMFKVYNDLDDNTSYIDATAIVRSTVAASSEPVYLQVYRGGSTNDWVTMDSDTATAGNTDITLTATQITTNLSDYYFAEMPGETCDAASTNCWTYWRVYQDPVPSSGVSQILSVDYVNISYQAGVGQAGGGDNFMRGGIRIRGGTSL